jgi:isoleucyl-tRNA synthetase
MRNIFRTLLGYLKDFDLNKDLFDFDSLTIVDKFMFVKIVEYSTKVIFII